MRLNKISSLEIMEVLGESSGFVWSFTESMRNHGATVENRTVVNKRGYFTNQNFFDIDECLEKVRHSINTHPLKERYIKHWLKREQQLMAVKDSIGQNNNK